MTEPEITLKNCLDKMSYQNQIWSGILEFDLPYLVVPLRCKTLHYVVRRYTKENNNSLDVIAAIYFIHQLMADNS